MKKTIHGPAYAPQRYNWASGCLDGRGFYEEGVPMDEFWFVASRSFGDYLLEEMAVSIVSDNE